MLASAVSSDCLDNTIAWSAEAAGGFRPSWAQKAVVGSVRGAEEFPAAGRMSSESAVCKLLPAMPNPS
ncbi:hypothetical protein HispidOSU_008258 [Sigmodon hispidus]